jgi:trigger factor
MTIELGKYKGLGYKRPEVEVLHKEIDRFIDALLEQYKVEKDKSGGIEKNDSILLNFKAYHEGEKLPELSRKGYNLKVGNKYFYEDFESRLYGKKAGDRISFDMILPEDGTQNPLANETIKVEVQIISVKENVLPELTDELITSFEITDVSNIGDLREFAKNKIYHNKLLRESSSIINRMMKDIIDNTKVNLQDDVITSVKESVFSNFMDQLKSQSVKLDMYLTVKNMTEEELHEQCREEAKTYLSEKAVIEKIGRIEGITLNRDEVSSDPAEGSDQDQLYYQEVVKFLLKENTVELTM